MYLESLAIDKGTLFVGIVDIENMKGLSTDQLLDLVSEFGSNVNAVQLFNGAKIVDVQHLLSAAQNAINAWNGGYAQSRSLSVEIAVFASGQHQIGRALSTIGVSDNLSSIAAVVIAPSKDEAKQVLTKLTTAIGKQCEPEFSSDPERLNQIMVLFDITKAEIESLIESDDPHEIQAALSRCVVSRVSTVAFDI
ncbi:MAG: KEOPS complex subunit Cgi121 [Candidatus Thorarchaeota archaeon]|jgi:tRNA threonylcarbamoyladenosine modification (KEOPS) complex Cgi121 subunit